MLLKRLNFMNSIQKGSTLFAMMAVLLVMPLANTVYAQSSDNSMIIQGNCGLVIGSAINFSNTAAAAESSEETLTLENSGATDGTVDVNGSNWIDDSTGLINVINGELTKFSPTNPGSGTYASKTALNSTNGDITIGDIVGGATNSTYWQVQATVNESSFTGAVTQTMTFAISC
jgi:hypothetical protein